MNDKICFFNFESIEELPELLHFKSISYILKEGIPGDLFCDSKNFAMLLLNV